MTLVRSLERTLISCGRNTGSNEPMARPTRNRNGRRIARLFRQSRRLSENERICDLDEIRAQDGIDLVISEVAEPGYTACLVCPGPGLPSGIILAPGQGRGRTRFSVAHELGHFHIPTHARRKTGWCGENDMAMRERDGTNYEWEANDFASELLMPQHLFAKDASTRDPIFGDIALLADIGSYDVSVTAAALRYVELTKEACALVCAREGVIEWVAKSESFFYRIPWRGDSTPVGSYASATFSGEPPLEGAEPIDPYAWLEVEQTDPVEVFESTFIIPTQTQVLSMVWVVVEEE